ncbi:probable dolichyl-diphosphooligosaccharide--protein glycosyltransferase subunit 3B [Nicotiana tomentosiformis]|uniref:probable dolichyl-diphosphooligosaccharide--protein glycosyltransferase subunit 3B n=1 Tax=Nicotiana tomentosiformis TaxID=4098 RepID=UPI00051B95C7|nr:probable dolichyl-diphosphooligosaccharide--protein glycosyltransferase subunit 3B [Nicotiana tomentosiformis]
MAISYNTTSFLFFTFLLLLVPENHSLTSDDLVSELIILRSKSPTGVIHLSNKLLRRILSIPVPRPFSFVVFFDSQKLHSEPEISLPTIKNEFLLLSSSFHTDNPHNKKLFFFDIEFQESQASFALFRVRSLPYICLVPPLATDFKRDSIRMKSSDFSGHAESMAEFIEAKTKLIVGPIHRPAFISKKQKMIIIALGLILTPFLVKKIVAGNTLLHNKHIWMAGSVFIYFFSVSGTMYNIINKIPIAMVDRDDQKKLVFFYEGNGMQLGAEGFTVGFLYTIFGLLLAFITHVLVHVKSRNIQRLVMLLAIFVSFWAVKKVIYLYNWKTGSGLPAYI